MTEAAFILAQMASTRGHARTTEKQSRNRLFLSDYWTINARLPLAFFGRKTLSLEFPVSFLAWSLGAGME